MSKTNDNNNNNVIETDIFAELVRGFVAGGSGLEMETRIREFLDIGGTREQVYLAFKVVDIVKQDNGTPHTTIHIARGGTFHHESHQRWYHQFLW